MIWRWAADDDAIPIHVWQALGGKGAYVMARPPRRCAGSSGLSLGLKVHAARSAIRFGELPELDLGSIEQIVEHSQARVRPLPGRPRGSLHDATSSLHGKVAQACAPLPALPRLSETATGHSMCWTAGRECHLG